MNIEQKLIKFTQELLSRTTFVRKKIETDGKQFPYKSGFMKTLLDIEEVLSRQPLDLNRLRRDKFGISRMLDGTNETPIEQELLSLHEEIHELIKMAVNFNTHKE